MFRNTIPFQQYKMENTLLVVVGEKFECEINDEKTCYHEEHFYTWLLSSIITLSQLTQDAKSALF